MKVTYVADSTYVFEHEGFRVLTDPWIGTRIYGGAWLQWPRPVIEPEDLGPLDAVFISHVHEDHCDPATLARLDLSRAALWTMDKTPDLVGGLLRKSGISFPTTVHLPADGTPVEVGPGLRAAAIEADPSHELNHLIDSALLLRWGNDRAALFANDCEPHPGMADHVAGLDLRWAALPASGGSGYPACYDNLEPDAMAAARDRVVTAYLDSFVASVELLAPRAVSVCAGNHVVVGPPGAVDDGLTFLRAPAMGYAHAARHLADDAVRRTRALPLAEGETADLDATDLGTTFLDAADGLDEAVAARAAFVADCLSLPLDHEVDRPPSPEALEASFVTAAEHLLDRWRRRGTSSPTTLRVRLGDSERWGEIDLASERAVVTAGGRDDRPTLEVTADARLLARLLAGTFSWNLADAGAMLRYHREPDHFDREAFIALNWLHEPTSDPKETP